MNRIGRICLIAALGVLLLAAPAAAGGPVKLKAGVLRLTSSVPMFIAQEKGFFAEEGLEVEFAFFKSAQPVAVAMASGDIQIGATGITAGLYNAVAGGFKMTLVADKGRVWPGYQLVGLMVSNDAWAKGLKTLKDLKGRRVGVTQIGSTFHYMLGNLLAKAGLSLAEVKVVPLGGVKNMKDAVASGAIETAFMVQPFCSVMEAKGQGHRMLWVSEYMDYQIAAIFFGQELMADKKTAKAFLRAYIKACRYYYDNCLTKKQGRLVKGPGVDEVMGYISKYTGRRPELIARGLNYNDRNGELLAGDIERQIEWYRAQGFIKGDLDPKRLVDASLWREALEELGD